MEIPEEVSGAVPESEVRQRAVVSVVAGQVASRLETLMEEVMSRTENLHRATSILAKALARMAAGVPGTEQKAKEEIRRTLTPTERRAAYRLLIFWAQRDTRQKLLEGKLLGLGVWVSTGAFAGWLSLEDD